VCDRVWLRQKLPRTGSFHEGSLMKLTVWTYEGPPHVGAMRVATGMTGHRRRILHR